MYLSRIKLNTQKKATQIALAMPNRFHGAVEAAFDGPRTRKLWRIDTLHGARYLLLLSPDVPDLTHMQKQFGFEDAPGETRDYAPLLRRIEAGSRWQFRLTANPTFAKSRNGARGQVRSHVSDVYLYEWLFKKADNNGFSAEASHVTITEKRWVQFKKKDGHPVRFKAVTYEGILTVTDAEQMRQALTCGIGREKAYGMGLLTLMRVPDA